MATFETFFHSPSYTLPSPSIATYVNPYVLVGSIAILSPTVVGTISIYPALSHVDLATHNLSSQTYYTNPLCLIQNRGLSQDLSNHAFSLSHRKENVSGGWFMDSPRAPGPGWHAGYLRKVDDSKVGLVSETEGSHLSKHGSSALLSQNNSAMQMEETGDVASVYTIKNGINDCEGPMGNSFRRNQSDLCEVDPKHVLSGTELEVDSNIDSLGETSMLKSRHSHNTHNPRKNCVFT